MNDISTGFRRRKNATKSLDSSTECALKVSGYNTSIECKASGCNSSIEHKASGYNSSTERKASGCNWEIYKHLFSKPKSEESNEKRIASQNKHPEPRNMFTNLLQTSPEESNKQQAHARNKKRHRKSRNILTNYSLQTTLPEKSNKQQAHATNKKKHPKSRNILTNSLQTTLPEESSKHNANNKENKALTKHIAIDCEMVGVGDGTESIIARVSIVNKHGNCIYDKYVKPREKVVDYRTAVSGIRPEHLQDGEDFNIVQKEVAEILKGRVLVGHALKHDLSVLYLSHPRKLWRDTSRYKPFRQISRGNTPSLKKLAHELLGREIQVGEHSSVEDARAAMHLYMLYKNKWESDRKSCW